MPNLPISRPEFIQSEDDWRAYGIRFLTSTVLLGVRRR